MTGNGELQVRLDTLEKELDRKADSKSIERWLKHIVTRLDESNKSQKSSEASLYRKLDKLSDAIARMGENRANTCPWKDTLGRIEEQLNELNSLPTKITHLEKDIDGVKSDVDKVESMAQASSVKLAKYAGVTVLALILLQALIPRIAKFFS